MEHFLGKWMEETWSEYSEVDCLRITRAFDGLEEIGGFIFLYSLLFLLFLPSQETSRREDFMGRYIYYVVHKLPYNHMRFDIYTMHPLYY
jgi:hypothetical protein